jgi:hypothetical protein
MASNLPLRRDAGPATPTQSATFELPPKYVEPVESGATARWRALSAAGTQKVLRDRIEVDTPVELMWCLLNPYWRGLYRDGPYLLWLEGFHEGQVPQILRRINKFRGMDQLDDPSYNECWEEWRDFYESDEGKQELAPYKEWLRQLPAEPASVLGSSTRRTLTRMHIERPRTQPEFSDSDSSLTDLSYLSWSDVTGNTTLADGDSIALQASDPIIKAHQAQENDNEDSTDPLLKELSTDKRTTLDEPRKSLLASAVSPIDNIHNLINRGNKASHQPGHSLSASSSTLQEVPNDTHSEDQAWSFRPSKNPLVAPRAQARDILLDESSKDQNAFLRPANTSFVESTNNQHISIQAGNNSLLPEPCEQQHIVLGQIYDSHVVPAADTQRASLNSGSEYQHTSPYHSKNTILEAPVAPVQKKEKKRPPPLNRATLEKVAALPGSRRVKELRATKDKDTPMLRPTRGKKVNYSGLDISTPTPKAGQRRKRDTDEQTYRPPGKASQDDGEKPATKRRKTARQPRQPRTQASRQGRKQTSLTKADKASEGNEQAPHIQPS